jgi:hypothetical protein
MKDMTDIDGSCTRHIGTASHEILAPDGNVVAWAVDKPWAAMIAALLNLVEAEGLCHRWSSEAAGRLFREGE